MGLRINIAFSFFIHAVLIAAAMAVGLRDAVFRIPETSMIVTLLRDLSDKTDSEEKGRQHNREKLPLDVPATPPGSEKFSGKTPRLQEEKRILPPPLPVTEPLPNAPSTEKTAAGVIKADRGNDGMILDVGKATPLPIGSPIHLTTGDRGSTAEGKSGHVIPQDSYSDIRGIIRSAIEKAVIYPVMAKKKGIEGTTTIRFSINNRGYPENLKIIRSSGSGVLDRAAEETVFKASPFPVTVSSIEIPVTFRLKKD